MTLSYSLSTTKYKYIGYNFTVMGLPPATMNADKLISQKIVTNDVKIKIKPLKSLTLKHKILK